ncbi:MAG: DUF2837 family protein [Armatimonadota bacterium]
MFEQYLIALKDPKLIFIAVMAGIVALLTANTIASRPAAVITRRVATSNTLHNVFFMFTRFANFFYIPLLATYVDRAVLSKNIGLLNIQLRIIIWGAFLGGVALWLLLPTFVELFCKGVRSFERSGSMVKVVLMALNPLNLPKIIKCFKRPTNFGVSLFNLEGLPAGFLIWNVIGTGIWTVGVLCALYVSAVRPEYKVATVLLSGAVNSIAAIIFSTLVDPKASLITDEVIAGERPKKHIYITAVFLTAGTVLGMILSQFLFMPGVAVVEFVAVKMAQGVGGSIALVVSLAVLVAVLYSTTAVSRVSAVVTKRVATAIAVYNLFFLITRLAQQIYAPIIGTIVDFAVKTNTVFRLEGQLRWIILGTTFGMTVGFILMPTFIEIYNKGIRGMEKYGSLPKVILFSLMPNNWGKWVRCLRTPSVLGVKLSEIRQIPRNFLIYNIIVIAIHTIGVLAATYAGALCKDFARQAALLSGVVNGVATILMGLIVDPMASLITDQAVSGQRPKHHVEIMAVFLIVGMIVGTVVSQLIFMPSAHFIKWCSEMITKVF